MKNLILTTGVLATLIFSGCGGGSGSGYGSSGSAGTSNGVALQSASRDITFMVNATGESLYEFDADTLDTTNCDAACQAIWPIFAAGITANTDFTLISGSTQTLYRHHALYTFVNDLIAGDINGDEVKGVWHLVYPANDFVATPDALLSTAVMTQKFLTANTGATLYTFDNDTQGVSNCNDGCAAIWPPYLAEVDTTKLPEGLSAADITTITRADGSKQLALKGQPLYLFANDPQIGDVNGDWVNGIWHLIELSDAPKI